MASNYDLQVDVGKRIFMQYDHDALIRKFRLDSDALWIFLTYMNTPFRISRTDGRIDEWCEGKWTPCRRYNTVMTIYDLLCYHKGPQLPSLCGAWCSVGTFIVTGVQNTDTFTEPYALKFDAHAQQLRVACQKLGGRLSSGKAGADVSCEFPVTSFFPVFLQFWQGDDEFPPKLLLLWDRNADQFLHFETTFFLQADLLERLWQHMSAE